MTNRTALLAACASCIVACLAMPMDVFAYVRDYFPWDLVSSGVNGTLKSLSYAPSQSLSAPGVTAANGVVFAGGDDGGAWRSLDCGLTWEHVNGGPGVTEGINGGYGCGNACGAHRAIYFGPPGSDHLNTEVADFAAGKMPVMPAVPGTQATYRSGKNLWWSNEDGKQWYPLSTYCLGVSDRFTSTLSLMAAHAYDSLIRRACRPGRGRPPSRPATLEVASARFAEYSRA